MQNCPQLNPSSFQTHSMRFISPGLLTHFSTIFEIIKNRLDLITFEGNGTKKVIFRFNLQPV